MLKYCYTIPRFRVGTKCTPIPFSRLKLLTTSHFLQCRCSGPPSELLAVLTYIPNTANRPTARHRSGFHLWFNAQYLSPTELLIDW